MDSQISGQKIEQKTNLIEVVAKYSASRFYRQAIGILTAYLRPKLLTPHDFGLYNLLRVVPDYVAYSHLGTNTALRYQVPQALAAGQHERAEMLEHTSWAATLLINGTVALVMLLLGILGPFEPVVRWGLGIMSFGFVLAGIFEFQMSLLKAHEQFPLLTRTNYVSITLTTVLTVIMLVLWGVYGLFISFTLAQLLSVMYVQHHFPRKLNLTINKPILKEMIAYGFPIMTLGVVIALVQTEDRLMVSYLLGNEQLGFYGISSMVMSFLLNVPGAAREVLEPRMMKELGSSSSTDLTERYFINPLLNTSFLMPLLLGPVVICLPVAVALLLPKYQQGVSATQILAAGGFFIAQVLVLRGIIAGRNRQAVAARLLLIPLILNVPGCWLAVKLGFGIAGIAFSSAVAYLMVYALLVGLMVHDLSLKGTPLWRACWWRMVLPFPLMALLLWISESWQPTLDWRGIPLCLIKSAIYVGLMYGFGRLAKMQRVDEP